MGDNYAKELTPPKSLDLDHLTEPLVVYLNISIQSLLSIDTVNLKFTADFFLNLRWYDGRLSFRQVHFLERLIMGLS